jgi:hypothetical protein
MSHLPKAIPLAGDAPYPRIEDSPDDDRLRRSVVSYLIDQRDLHGCYDFPDPEELADGILTVVRTQTRAEDG